MTGELRKIPTVITGRAGVQALTKPAGDPWRARSQRWQLRQEFQLTPQQPVPAPIESQSIIRGINAKGYYIWRVGKW
jgi:hypothetical protein